MKKEDRDNALTRYLLSIQEEYSKNYEEATAEINKQAIHDLRVSLKKLKSSLTLLGILVPEFESKIIFKSTRSLFKKLGKIRDLQVTASLIQNNDIFRKRGGKRFHKFLERRIKRKESHLKKWVSHFESNSIEETFFEAINHSKQLVDSWILDSSTILIRTLKSEISDYKSTELHRARISLKQVHHTMDICHNIDPDFLTGEINTDQLGKIEKLLGDWHDQVILKSILIKYIKKNKNSGMKKFYNQTEKSIKSSVIETKKEFKKIGL